MAKRKRLTPPNLAAGSQTVTPPSGLTPPIAQMAGASAAFSAARTLEDQMETARATGRLIITLPLGAVVESHLVRDRLGVDAPEMDALKASLAAHGQRSAIEVEDLGEGRFGLISGWRRLTALKALHEETGEERFSRIAALIRTPADRAEAYVAMVEENEIRAGLSYYERARIAARAAAQGAFETPEAAVNALFAAGSRARRSKIRSFLRIHESLDGVLNFPAHLPERLGLKLAEALKNGQGPRLAEHLETSVRTSPEVEASVLARLLKHPGGGETKSGGNRAVLISRKDLKLSLNKAGPGFSFSVSGARADAELCRKLSDLLLRELG